MHNLLYDTLPCSGHIRPYLGFCSRFFKDMPMPAAFDDLWIGQVASLGAGVVSEEELNAFCKAWAPGWDPADGLPDSLVFTLWSKLESEASREWPQTKRLAVDALRWMRNPPAGELLRGRLTVMGKDAVGATKGVVIAQNDVLDEAGRLVFSCLTRSVFQRNPMAPDESGGEDDV